MEYLTPERKRRSSTARHKRLREEVIRLYGGECACCHESRYEFMAIDHIHGGGNAEKKAGGPKTCHAGVLQSLIKNIQRDKYRILCHNCNLAKGIYGRCPHESENN